MENIIMHCDGAIQEGKYQAQLLLPGKLDLQNHILLPPIKLSRNPTPTSPTPSPSIPTPPFRIIPMPRVRIHTPNCIPGAPSAPIHTRMDARRARPELVRAHGRRHARQVLALPVGVEAQFFECVGAGAEVDAEVVGPWVEGHAAAVDELGAHGRVVFVCLWG